MEENNMMNALQFERFGGPEVLELVQLPIPEAPAGHVRIRVTRAGVNFADLVRIEGLWGSKQLPQIQGAEVVGTREDTGQRVLALLPAGGGFAQYAVASEHLTYPISDDINDDTALALFEQGLTAFHILRSSARIMAGESVVVQAAAGGVGSLALQLARIFGASRVIAVASTAEKRALTLRLGADVAVSGHGVELKERLLEANEGKGVDIVLDSIGGDVFDQSLQALAPFGRVVTYGQASGVGNSFTTDDLDMGSKGIVAYWLKHTLDRRETVLESLDEMFEFFRVGRLQPVIGATYALGQAVTALQDLAARRTQGKLLVDTQTL
jgi:NADPH:quinone reductase